MTLYDDYFQDTVKYKKIYGEKTLVLIQVGSFYEIYALKDTTGGVHFTCIEDVCKIVTKLIFSKKIIDNQIFNICSDKPINLSKIIDKINILTNRRPRLYKRSLQKADVIKTHGSNKKIIKKVGKIKFTTIEVGLMKTVKWFKKYYKI